jgi:dTDP-4-dehydrorhamnose 3,5-epimerase
MKGVETRIADVRLLEPQVFEDSRGSFFESYNKRVLAELGIRGNFVQDNQSFPGGTWCAVSTTKFDILRES